MNKEREIFAKKPSDYRIESASSVWQDMLTKATQEGKAATADLCSTRLDKLATHAANEGLSAAEIVELIREEAAAIC
ncbi:DUF2732 family protein, partial [Salmonella enterica subsp. enterica serovar Corvallis]|nr:DUF2732 family protein [Salmonella enterica subsp. enterica serovar Corvallis]